MKTILIIAAVIALGFVGYEANSFVQSLGRLSQSTATANQILDEALAGK